jgi:hypothetical protein
MRLQPTSAGDVDDAWRVNATIVVPAKILNYSQQADAEGLTNHEKMLILGSRLPSPFACAAAEVTDKDNRGRNTFRTEVIGCLVVISKGSEQVTLAPVGGGDSVTLLRKRGGKLADVPLNDPNILRVTNGAEKLTSQLVSDC